MEWLQEGAKSGGERGGGGGSSSIRWNSVGIFITSIIIIIYTKPGELKRRNRAQETRQDTTNSNWRETGFDSTLVDRLTEHKLSARLIPHSLKHKA